MPMLTSDDHAANEIVASASSEEGKTVAPDSIKPLQAKTPSVEICKDVLDVEQVEPQKHRFNTYRPNQINTQHGAKQTMKDIYKEMYGPTDSLPCKKRVHKSY